MDHATCRRLGAALGAAALFVVLSGCSNYRVTLECGPRVNSYDLTGATGGRALRVAVVALGDRDFQQLSQDGSFGKIDLKQTPWTAIKAATWFKGGGAAVRRVVGDPEAVKEEVVAAGKTFDVDVKQRYAGGRNSGILVLADYSGSADDKPQFVTAVWLRTDSWWFPRRAFTVRCEETALRRVE